MLNSKSGFMAAAAAAILGVTAGGPAVDLVQAAGAGALYQAPRRGRSRMPFGNTYKPLGRRGPAFNRDTGTEAGVPGSKLARKAAEGRLGVFTGRAKSAAHRALTK